jgi:hypothetical protein
MAAAFFRRCAHIPAFFYYLELKPALIANINFTLSHFMTISHFTNLLSGAQTILVHIKGWVSGARKSREISSGYGVRWLSSRSGSVLIGEFGRKCYPVFGEMVGLTAYHHEQYP